MKLSNGSTYLINFTKLNKEQRTMVALVNEVKDNLVYVTDLEINQPRTIRLDSILTVHTFRPKGNIVSVIAKALDVKVNKEEQARGKYTFKKEGGVYVVRILDRVVGKVYKIDQVARLIQHDMAYSPLNSASGASV